MGFFGDYHTHTVFSHGKGTIRQNVMRAREIGLKQIAITDHGFRHITYNVRRTDFHFMIDEVKKLNQEFDDINILLGLETNFNGINGDIDIMPTDVDMLDIVLCGYHKFVRPARFKEYPLFYYPNFFFDSIMYTPPFMVRRNTDAYIKALERYDIDVITHLNYGCRVLVAEVAKAAAHFGTYIELNGKQINMSDGDLIKISEAGTKFIVNSDAHSVGRVGDFSRQMNYIKKLGIPFSQIVNYNNIPVFRSQERKKKEGKQSVSGAIY